MKTVHARIPDEVLEWVEKQIREGRFASLSHAVRYALVKLMREEGS